MFHNKGELLKICRPRGMTRGNFVLAMEVFKRLMVGVKDELAVEEVVPPMLDGLNYCIKFDVVCAVVFPRPC